MSGTNHPVIVSHPRRPEYS